MDDRSLGDAEPSEAHTGQEATAPPEPPAVLRDSVEYDGRPPVIAAARAFVEEFIDKRDRSITVTDRQRGAAALVTSELVTNAVRHAPGPFQLRLELAADLLQIAVSDNSASQPLVRPHDPARIGQHGMEIVHALCGSVVVEATDNGKTITALLAIN